MHTDFSSATVSVRKLDLHLSHPSRLGSLQLKSVLTALRYKRIDLKLNKERKISGMPDYLAQVLYFKKQQQQQNTHIRPKVSKSFFLIKELSRFVVLRECECGFVCLFVCLFVFCFLFFLNRVHCGGKVEVKKAHAHYRKKSFHSMSIYLKHVKQ